MTGILSIPRGKKSEYSCKFLCLGEVEVRMRELVVSIPNFSSSGFVYLGNLRRHIFYSASNAASYHRRSAQGLLILALPSAQDTRLYSCCSPSTQPYFLPPYEHYQLYTTMFKAQSRLLGSLNMISQKIYPSISQGNFFLQHIVVGFVVKRIQHAESYPASTVNF